MKVSSLALSYYAPSFGGAFRWSRSVGSLHFLRFSTDFTFSTSRIPSTLRRAALRALPSGGRLHAQARAPPLSPAHPLFKYLPSPRTVIHLIFVALRGKTILRNAQRVAIHQLNVDSPLIPYLLTKRNENVLTCVLCSQRPAIHKLNVDYFHTSNLLTKKNRFNGIWGFMFEVVFSQPQNPCH